MHLPFLSDPDDLAYLRFRRVILAQKMDDARDTIRTVVLTGLGSLVAVTLLIAVCFN